MKINITPAITVNDVNAYSDHGAKQKEAFHREGKKFMKSLAEELGLEPDSYDVRSNKGGIAVSGEITLHGENIYVQLSTFGRSNILYRTCNGRKDYSGDSNNHVNTIDLGDPEKMHRFVSNIKSMIERKLTQTADIQATRRPRM